MGVLSVGLVRVGPLEVGGSQGMLFSTCLLILTSLGPSLAGHYLFWMPFGSKSMKIGVMNVVYELAEKGHTTTVVTAFKSKTERPRVKEIVIDSDFVGLVQGAIGGILVKKGVDVPWDKMMEQTIKDNRAAFNHPEVQQLLKEGSGVDVVCVVPFGNEPGYYFAKKMNATLALVWTGTQMVPWISWAMGDSFDPATQPMPLLGFTHPMTLVERVLNTLATGLMAGVNEFYLRPKSHQLLAELFPDDKTIPSMDSMAKTSALLVTHSSPFLGHGLQPAMPQTVHSGLMGCTPAKPLKDDLKLFITHAGAGSLQESICYTTPIIAVPINSDQFANAKEAVRLGIGVTVDWHSLTEETLAKELRKMLEEENFQTKVDTLQRRILDTPQHPLDGAVWWLEYLLRHPGNPAMRSRSHDLHWTQSMMLDVGFLFLLLGLLVLAIVYAIVCRCCLSINKRKEKSE